MQEESKEKNRQNTEEPENTGEESVTGEEQEAVVTEEAPAQDLEKKLKEYEDNYLRVHADFENTKKRLEKEKYVALDYAYEKFAQELLPALDSLDAALAAVKNTEESEVTAKIKEGLELTQEQFLKVFNKHGITKISSDEEFNPHCHEAVMNVASDAHEDGQIVQMLQAGYKYKERVLRPALVSICKK